MIGFFFFKLEYLKGKVKWHNTKNCKEYGYKKKKKKKSPTVCVVVIFKALLVVLIAGPCFMSWLAALYC